MSNINATSFDLSINQTFSLIKAIGNKNTVLVEGHMGAGKTTLLKMLAEAMPTHTPVYFDCTTKDLMDLSAPKVMTWDDTGKEYLTMVPNEELGLHLDKPVILMFDEWGKNKGIKLGTLRVMLERQIGSHKLHPDSIVFCTTNLGAERLGDLLEAHARNRLVVVRMRKATAEEWVDDYAISAGVHEVVMAWVTKEAPHVFQSFEEVDNPDADEAQGGNPHIYHPKRVGGGAFTTHRSMKSASDIIYQCEGLDSLTLRSALAGCIGVRASSDLISYMKIAEQMPSIDDIKESPKTAKIPDSPAAVCMVVLRTLRLLDRSWVNAWMDYFARLGVAEQAMFALSVRKDKYPQRELVMTNKKYTEWCLANQHIYQADKK
jgi:energy-coupling factor transporter ATP-binding protein EcfA2